MLFQEHKDCCSATSRETIVTMLKNKAQQKHEEAVKLHKLADFLCRAGVPTELEEVLAENFNWNR